MTKNEWMNEVGCWNLSGFREAVELMEDFPEGDD